MRGASLLIGALLAMSGCERAFMIEVHAGGTDMARVELYLGIAPCAPDVCDDVAIPGIPSPQAGLSYVHDGPEPFGADGSEPIYLELRASELGDYIPVAIAVGFDASKQIVGSALMHDLQLVDSVINRVELTPLDTPGHQLWFQRQPSEPKSVCVAREESVDKIALIVPAGDPDCDGVDVSSDLCPGIYDPGQRDFDGDKRSDACDPCPHLAAPSASSDDPDRDTDGDGVGDGCDPDPIVGGDRRALWSGFYEPSDLTGWTVEAGTWTVGPSGVSQTAPGLGAGLRASVVVESAFIQTRYQVTTLEPQVDAEVGVCAGIQANIQRVVCCDVIAKAAGQKLIETWWHENGALQLALTRSWPGRFVADSVIELDYTLSPSSSKCVGRGHEDSSLPVSEVAAMPGPADSSGTVSLYMKHATARFDYVFVVEPSTP